MIKKNILKLQSILKLVNSDVLHTGLTNLARILTGPVSMILIPLFLTKQMQGYWYSFSSLSALSIFADLGFTAIVGQFSAHEYAYLNLSNNRRLEGDAFYIGRIASFFRFVLKWGFAAVIITFPIIFIVGYYILKGEVTEFNWVLPWVIFLVASGILFVLNIINAFFEGCDQIAKSQQIAFISILISFIIIVVVLVCGFNLYAIALGTLAQAIVRSFLIYRKFGTTMKQLLTEKAYHYRWEKEVLQLLWRYAISWSSGYFIFQLFTPVAFKFYGSEVAGQVGITLALVMAVFSFSNIWMFVANPKMNMLVSLKNWIGLDNLFKRQLSLSIITFLIGGTAFILLFISIPEKWNFTERFLNLGTIFLLLLAWLMQLIINALAMYMRAHKKEPLVIPSIMLALFIGVTTFLIANNFSSQYLFGGFLISFIWNLPLVYYTYIKEKKILH